MNRHWRRAVGLACGLLATALAVPAFAAEKKAAADDSDWVSLFDGKTLSGWEIFEMSPKNPSKPTWEVVDGALVGSGGQSMIYSPRADYKNYKFRAEIKINDKGNSGMYFRTPKGATFMNGYECQINATHGDPIKTGSIYLFVNLTKDSNPPPPDTFFTQEIEVEDITIRGKAATRIRVRIDGSLKYEFFDYAMTWKDGAVGFQQHDPGSKVTIRKIEIMELPAKKK
jgi:hypothetical protein